MIYFLVGPMGCGKNYVGKRLAEQLGCSFLDGDSFIPQAMAAKICQFRPLGQQDIDDYVAEHLIPGINAAHRPEALLVVAQALYRQEHRQQIMKFFKGYCEFIYVASPLLINIRRLLGREKGLRWALYGLLNRPFFQKTDLLFTIENGNQKLCLETLITQLNVPQKKQ